MDDPHRGVKAGREGHGMGSGKLLRFVKDKSGKERMEVTMGDARNRGLRTHLQPVIGGVHLAPAVKVRRTAALGTGDYLPAAYFPVQGQLADAAQFWKSGEDVFSGLPQSEPIFNPSLAALPPELVSRIHPAAAYSATTRHRGDQCRRLGVVRRHKMTTVSSIAILAANFSTLAVGALPFGEDHRLLVVGDTLMTTFMTYRKKWSGGRGWHLVKLDLKREGISLHARYSEPGMQGLPHSVHLRHSRNLGVFRGEGSN